MSPSLVATATYALTHTHTHLARRRGDPGPRVVVLGTPLAYLPHGKVPDLLAQLGLDGAGIAAATLKALRDLERAGGAKV